MTKHAIARAYQRYSLSLTGHDLKRIAADIQENKGALAHRFPDGKTAWRLDVQGVPCIVVIDRTFYHIITFLRLDATFDGSRRAPAKAKRPRISPYFYIRGRRVLKCRRHAA